MATYTFYTSPGRQNPVNLQETEASLASIGNSKPAKAR